jgi:hypothetical protein
VTWFLMEVHAHLRAIVLGLGVVVAAIGGAALVREHRQGALEARITTQDSVTKAQELVALHRDQHAAALRKVAQGALQTATRATQRARVASAGVRIGKPVAPASGAKDTTSYTTVTRPNDTTAYLAPTFFVTAYNLDVAALDSTTAALGAATLAISAGVVAEAAKDTVIADLQKGIALRDKRKPPLLGFRSGVVAGLGFALAVLHFLPHR